MKLDTGAWDEIKRNRSTGVQNEHRAIMSTAGGHQICMKTKRPLASEWATNEKCSPAHVLVHASDRRIYIYV